jgi:hypothetical protein
MSATPWLLQGAGFDLILAKPFPLKQLVEAIQHLCCDGMMPEAAPNRLQATPAVSRAGV